MSYPNKPLAAAKLFDTVREVINPIEQRRAKLNEKLQAKPRVRFGIFVINFGSAKGYVIRPMGGHLGELICEVEYDYKSQSQWKTICDTLGLNPDPAHFIERRGELIVFPNQFNFDAYKRWSAWQKGAVAREEARRAKRH